MVTGRVNRRFDAVIPIELVGPDSQVALSAAADTGFDGYLMAPPEIIERLRLPSRGRRTARLADAREVTFNTYRGSVLLDDRRIDVTVLEGGTQPLAGMRLLNGFRLTIDVVVDGSVSIEPVP